MEQEIIFDDISNLPPEAQQQVADFIAFLRTRYKQSDAEKPTKRIKLSMSLLSVYGRIVRI